MGDAKRLRGPTLSIDHPLDQLDGVQWNLRAFEGIRSLPASVLNKSEYDQFSESLGAEIRELESLDESEHLWGCFLPAECKLLAEVGRPALQPAR